MCDLQVVGTGMLGLPGCELASLAFGIDYSGGHVSRSMSAL